MTPKFFEEFTKISNGAFPELKLNSATYFKEKRELAVRFIISAFEIKRFDESKQARVSEIVGGMFPGVKISVQYIKTYADANVVRNKILEFFNSKNQLVFRRIADDSIDVSVSDAEINVLLRFDTPTYKMLFAGGTVDELREFLDVSFNQRIDIVVEELFYAVNTDIGANDDVFINTTVVKETNLRLVSVSVLDKIYSRGKIAGINQMPNYICDVKGAADNIVLCGKITNISKRMYKNKKYNPDDPKFGNAELPLIRFILDDTTAKIECVCFPNGDEASVIESIPERSQIVCAGKVGVSSYNNALSFAVNAIFNCEIDFGSIKLVSVKPEPERYETIFPVPYTEVGQKSLFDEENEAPDYFKGKTFVVFDFEATDIMTEAAEVIEIAAVKVVDGVSVESFSTLTKPSVDIPHKITEITSIDNEMVAHSPSFEAVLPDFYKFTRGAVLVGHNISGYDYPLLAKYAAAAGYNFDNDMEDTLLLAKKYITEVHSYSLESLSKNLGISHENAHRAMSDVLATRDLFQIIAKRMAH